MAKWVAAMKDIDVLIHGYTRIRMCAISYKVQILINSTSISAVGEIGRRIEFKPLRVNLISVQVRYGTYTDMV